LNCKGNQIMAGLGYDDTPVIPNMGYKVHGSERPQPRIVTPEPLPTASRQALRPTRLWFSTAPIFPVWEGGEGKPAAWKVEQGYMEVTPGSGNIRSTQQFGDCQLHVEWAAPVEVKGEGQGRGNSGVFLMGRYEIQVLDCYRTPLTPMARRARFTVSILLWSTPAARRDSGRVTTSSGSRHALTAKPLSARPA
jgi:hypothetical protein